MTDYRYANGKKTNNNYGRRGWRSADGLFNEGQLLSGARLAAAEGKMEEFLEFYRQHVPADVLERVQRRVE